MKKMIMAVLAAGLMTSGAVVAQDAAAPGMPPQDPNAPSVAVEGGAPVALGVPAEQTKVQIVLLSALAETAPPIDLAEDADELAALHASIEDNAAVKRQLGTAGYGIDDVVAMANNVDGSIIVYVDDRG